MGDESASTNEGGVYPDTAGDMKVPPGIRSDVLQVLEVCGSKLRLLDVTDCPLITDASLRGLGQRCGVLESLGIGMCPLLTNGAIKDVSTVGSQPGSGRARLGFDRPEGLSALRSANRHGDVLLALAGGSLFD